MALDKNDFYIPSQIETIEGGPLKDKGIEEWFKGLLKYNSEESFDNYQEALNYEIAREQARLLLSTSYFRGIGDIKLNKEDPK